jgi:hypothetical protein
MPGLQDAFDKHKDSVTLVALDVGPFIGLGTEEDARALLADLGISIPAGATPDASVVRQYRVLGTRTTPFLSPDGEVVRW